MNNLTEVLESKDFENLVLWAGGKYLKKLRITGKELMHEVRISMWINLRDRSLNISYTTLIVKHTLYTVFRIFKKMKSDGLKNQARLKYISEQNKADRAKIARSDNLGHLEENANIESLMKAGRLDDRLKLIMTRRINGDTLESIAKDLSVSKERIRQLEERAIKKMREGSKSIENNFSRC